MRGGGERSLCWLKEGRKISLLMVSLLWTGVWSQNVGIGTTTPTAMLHIQVPTGYAMPLLKAEQQGTTAPYLIVLPNGHVGIGIANPSEVLDVAGNVQFSGALMPSGNAGSAGQVLVSQGPGLAPQWQSVNNLGINCNNSINEYGPFVDANGDSVAACTVTMNFIQCLQACNSSTYKGLVDWRIPLIDELYLYKRSGGMDYNSWASCYHWAGPLAGIDGSGAGYGYIFRPSDALINTDVATSSSYYCRCVR